jgi:nitrogen fixation/metabolism regulation signal transduction histidine kinase
MQDWEQTYTSYKGIRPRWYELQAAGQTQAAAEYRQAYMTPGGAASVAALQRLIDLQRAQADEAQQAVLAEARAAQIRQLGSLGLALVIGLAVSLLVARSIVRPMLQMADAAQRLAEGDINQEVTVRSRDEIGQLGSAFNTMIAYQQQMADAADKISQGNLAVDVEPKSPKDVLGQAFQRMTTNLRRMAAAADAISRGDLRAGRVVDLMPQSADDVFGHAFQRLVAQMRRLQARERDGAGDRPLTADRR